MCFPCTLFLIQKKDFYVVLVSLCALVCMYFLFRLKDFSVVLVSLCAIVPTIIHLPCSLLSIAQLEKEQIKDSQRYFLLYFLRNLFITMMDLGFNKAICVHFLSLQSFARNCKRRFKFQNWNWNPSKYQ